MSDCSCQWEITFCLHCQMPKTNGDAFCSDRCKGEAVSEYFEHYIDHGGEG